MDNQNCTRVFDLDESRYYKFCKAFDNLVTPKVDGLTPTRVSVTEDFYCLLSAMYAEETYKTRSNKVSFYRLVFRGVPITPDLHDRSDKDYVIHFEVI